jgi:hypothetical protein
MKQAKDAFAAAIERAEKAMRGKSRSEGRGAPKERSHAVTKLSAERAKRRKDEAQQIVQHVRRLGLDPETLEKIDAAAKAHAQSTENWIFVMLSPAQNAEVIRWINKRPHKAVELWATVLEHLRIDTGEIMATRQELAERVGETPQNLSRIITELSSINAIRREKEGRKVKYYLNPAIATHLPNAASRAKARKEAGPLLKLMEGGRE